MNITVDKVHQNSAFSFIRVQFNKVYPGPISLAFKIGGVSILAGSSQTYQSQLQNYNLNEEAD